VVVDEWVCEEVTGRGRSPPRPLLAVPNVTAHPSTASVSITILQYRPNGPLLCGFNVCINGLIDNIINNVIVINNDIGRISITLLLN